MHQDLGVKVTLVPFISPEGYVTLNIKPEYSNIYRSLLIKLYIKGNTYDSKKMYMSGSFLIFDRETFIKAGKFDEKIFMYYEEPDITNKKDAKILKAEFERLQVPAWVDLWGHDVNHDWPWWLIQFPYFVDKILYS